MSRILVGSAQELSGSRDVLHGMFSFRHKVFHERLGWAVNSQDGMERDAFDEIDPVYIVARNIKDQVEGCWRFLPTTGPYMLKDTFPQLLRGEQAPGNPGVLEISRFAVETVMPSRTVQVDASHITLEILQAAYTYASERNIERFVAVTSVAMERFLKRIDIPMSRFGDGKAQKVGGLLSVACWIDVDERFRSAVFPDQLPVAA